MQEGSLYLPLILLLPLNHVHFQAVEATHYLTQASQVEVLGLFQTLRFKTSFLLVVVEVN